MSRLSFMCGLLLVSLVTGHLESYEAMEMAKERMSKDETDCNVCRILTQSLIDFISSDTTEDEIVDQADRTCNALGGEHPSFETRCRVLVANHLDTIVTLIVQGSGAADICTHINVC